MGRILDPEIYPFAGKFLDIGGFKCHYLDEGNGRPVLMLHGNPTWSIYYRNLIVALRASYRCIAPDHIGCGLSEKPDDSRYRYTLRRRVEDLEEFLDALGLKERLTLVLHDWGGMIGMAYATRHPEAIAKIVLLNTAAFHLPKGKSFPFPLWLSRTCLGSFLILHFNAFSRGAAYLCCARKKMPRALRDAYCFPYDSRENRIATLRFVQDIPLRKGDEAYRIVSEVQNDLRRLQDKPVLICWGERDFVFDVRFLHEWIKYFPAAQVHRFPDCGHYVLEDAADEIAGLIANFIP